MDRENLILITLFVIVLVLAGFLLLYDPSNIGKEDKNTETKKPIGQPYIPPEQRPDGLIKPTEPVSGLPEPIVVPNETILQPQPPQEDNVPENYSEVIGEMNKNVTIPPEPFQPKVPLPKIVSNPEQVCDTMCKFRDSTMNRVEERGTLYYCICQNGYERSIGNIF